MVPRTSKRLQERAWNTPAKGPAWGVGVRVGVSGRFRGWQAVSLYLSRFGSTSLVRPGYFPSKVDGFVPTHPQCRLENSQVNPTEAELDRGEGVDRQSRPDVFDDTRPTDPGSAYYPTVGSSVGW